jgi:prophage regulatory protein
MTDYRPLRLIREDEVCSKTLYTRVHIYNLEARGQFPKRVKLGARRVAWVETEVDDWIKAKMAERDGGSANGAA